MKAIILAAGRGSRLLQMTDGRPKCLVELAGQALLRWQADALMAGGVDQIVVVTGYQQEMVDAQGFPTVHNPAWQTTNMVTSLLCAAAVIDEPVIVSYSDIVYAPKAVELVCASNADLGVAYDRDWLGLWQDRFDEPLSDAETFRIRDDGLLAEIGKKVENLDDVDGQYMGLLRFSPTSMAWIGDIIDSDHSLAGRLDMTALLDRLIAAGHPITGIDATGIWCEIDTQRDLAVAESLVACGKLSPFPEQISAS